MNGVAQLHFDTRPQTPLYKLRNFTPDVLLPKAQKKGIIRVRRNSTVLQSLFALNNLKIVQELNLDSELHTVILEKSSRK